MANVKLEHVFKVYPNGARAVSDFTMDIKDQEFIVFVGPSGCGKSTTLRMIAGLEDISAGELFIDDKLMNNVEPKDRDIAMVFQNYALYPHMTVYENLAFGLRLRHVPNSEIHSKILWAADILGLKDYLDRTPKAMSGGQRQRVALGRAILRNPKVMLLDEPLSNLDAKLRAQMRTEIANLHQELKTTFIYVTHDQVEAMTLGTRVVVMKLGVIQQIDTPTNLYDYPINRFVAGFIGTPQMNFLRCTLKREGESVRVNFVDCSKEIVVPYERLRKVESTYLNGDVGVIFGVRSEHAKCDEEGIISLKVTNTEQLGNETLIYGDLKENISLLENSNTKFVLKSVARDNVKVGDIIKISLDLEHIHLFDEKTEESILNPLPRRSVLECSVKDNKIEVGGVTFDLPSAIKVPDVTGYLRVPCDALGEDEKGHSWEILDHEVINSTHLYTVKLGNSQVFMTLDHELKEGSKLSLDLSKVEMTDLKGKKVLEKLNDLNEIPSNFLNYKTTIDRTHNEDFVKYHDQRVEDVKAKYESLMVDLKAKYEQDLGTKKASLSESEAKAKLAELKSKKKEADLKAKEGYKQASKEEKDAHKERVKAITDEINEIYRKRKEEEDSTYKEFMKYNKDGDAKYQRKQEHYRFKENFPKEKENDMNLKLNSEEVEYETKANAIVSSYKRAKKLNSDTYKEEVLECKKSINPSKYITKEYKMNLASLKKEYKDSLEKANLVYFFTAGSSYFLVDDFISSKLVQGLGTRVFSRDYVLKLTPDKYYEKEDGIEFEVVDVLDYGTKVYYKCKNVASLRKDSVIHLLKKDVEHKIGDVIKVKFDIVDTQIFETSLNIRLY